jgi:cardiolipin synthase
MSDFMILLTIGETIWVVALSAWIILERRSPAATLAWILGLALLPLVGIVIYWLIGPRRLTRKRRRYKAARSRVRQAAVAGRAAPTEGESGPNADGNLRQFMQLVERSGEAPPLRCRSLEVYGSGDACYASIEKAMAEARHHIHLEYYIWAPDRVGTRWRDLLCDKARSGVQVRLLVDAIGSDHLHRRFLKPLRESGA